LVGVNDECWAAYGIVPGANVVRDATNGGKLRNNR
jgi:hypothetical protein